MKDPLLAEPVVKELESQIYLMNTRLPAKAVAKLKRVKIWVELNDPQFPGGVYHPNADWLREHHFNPAKAKCVEISNARHLLTWTKDQPYMLLHEFAHAY